MSGKRALLLASILMSAMFMIPVPTRPVGASPPELQALFHLNPRAVKNESLTINSTFVFDIELDIMDENASYTGISFVLNFDGTIIRILDIADVLTHPRVPQTEWDKLAANHTIRNVLPNAYYDYTLPPDHEPISGNHSVAVAIFQVMKIGKCPLVLSLCKATNPTGVNLVSSSMNGTFSNFMSGDLNGDGSVNLLDALLLAKSFGATPNMANWNEDADINGDGVIDIYDVLLLCRGVK